MSFKLVTFWSALSTLLTLHGGSRGPHPVPAQLHLTLATLHAAGLTTPREAGDSADAPYILVSIIGPGANAITEQLPTTGHLSIHLDQALGSRPLADLSLQPGDSVRLLLSVLEAAQVDPSDEAAAAAASTKALAESPAAQASVLAPALAPVLKQGAHWLGSAELLLTNEGGSTYWRALQCVATCKVLEAPTASPMTAGAPAAIAGVVELSGNGGTYHLQVKSQRAS
jgi:hypothetical protein